MSHFKYIIIGGGMTADSAVNGIRQIDPTGTIGIFSKEKYPPYNRPPLSKALWKGEAVESIWRNNKTENVEMHLSNEIKSINVKAKTVLDEHSLNYSFDKLLFATGGKVRKLHPDAEGIIYYRTLDNYYQLKSLTEIHHSFAVIGGGFIGSEITAALTLNDKSVTMIFPGEGIGSGIYPRQLSKFLNDYYRVRGVTVLTNQTVVDINKNDGQYLIITSSGKELKFDGVIAGLGISPNTELAEKAGLAIDNGIMVNDILETSSADIFAAGDVSNFYNAALERRMRVEHEDNSNMMGETAGKNMTGEGISYTHLPSFYSDLFDLGYEAIGELKPEYEIVEDWKEEFIHGVVYYLKEGKVRGVLLMNVWGQIDTARKLIEEKFDWDAKKIKGQIEV